MISLRTRRAKHAFSIVIDAVILAVSLNLMHVIFTAAGWQAFSSSGFGWSAAVISIFTLTTHLAVGLYESKVRENIRSVFRRGVLSVGLAFFAYQIVASIYPYPTHNLTLVSGLLLAVLFQSCWRYWAIHLGGLYNARRRVIFIGAGARASFVSKRMRRDVDRRAFAFLGFVKISSINEQVERCESVLTHDGGNFKDWLGGLDPDVIVLANDRGENIDVQALLALKMQGVEVVELEDFIESELRQIAVEKIRPESMLLSKGYTFNRFAFENLNYIFNATLSLIVLVLTFPIMLLAVIAIYFDDGRRDKAGFLYRQVRVGKNGRNFEIMKFRSMGSDAEKDGPQWASSNDMRVTTVGKYLRKYRIDELPQILNVLRGDMCFVGPRPERPIFVEKLAQEIPYFHYRHCVKPGLTGWAQICYPYGASVKDSFEKLKFDLYYIKHRSFLLDLFVLLRTVDIVIFGRGR